MKAENTAALAALKAAWNPAQVHEVGKVPATPVTPYAVPSVGSGAAGNYSLAAEHGTKSYRIAVQVFGKSVGEVGALVDVVDNTFLDKALSVPGYDTTPSAGEVSSPIIRDPDGGGLLMCLLTYTFTATATS